MLDYFASAVRLKVLPHLNCEAIMVIILSKGEDFD